MNDPGDFPAAGLSGEDAVGPGMFFGSQDDEPIKKKITVTLPKHPDSLADEAPSIDVEVVIDGLDSEVTSVVKGDLVNTEEYLAVLDVLKHLI